MLTPRMSSTIGVLILIVGFCLGFSELHIPYRILHLAIASSFILLTPLVVYVHSNRFYTKGPTDLIAWSHFVLFGFLLYLTVRMVRRWKSKTTSHFTENYVVTNKGVSYDLSDWITQKKHPGGGVISNIFKNHPEGKELDDIWMDEGVAWHTENKKVQAVLNQHKL